MRTLLVALLGALVLLSGCSKGTSTVTRLAHEDPERASEVFEVTALLPKVTEALGYVLAGDVDQLERLAATVSLANIPGPLKDEMQGALSSARSLAVTLSISDEMTERARALISQARIEEAKATLDEARQSVGVADRDWDRLMNLAIAVSRQLQPGSAPPGSPQLQPESAPPGSPQRLQYEEATAALLRLRSGIDQRQEMNESLNQTIEVGSEGVTELALSVASVSAFVGDPIQFQGRLMAEGNPLAGRKVALLLGGSPAAAVLTDSNGVYRGRVVLPYRYLPEVTARAIYYPEGDDIGLFLGSSSPAVAVKVLYYQTRLSLEVPGSASLGGSRGIKGSFDYGTNPVPKGRSLHLYWDGEQAAEETVASTFTLELAVAAETTLGKHRVTAYVPPQGRYAPAQASADVQVIGAAPVIELEGPGVMLLPLAQDIRGRVYSSLGPLQHASLKMALGNWEVTTQSRDDGTFEARLGTGMSLMLIGTQELRVSVAPAEPWHRPASPAVSVLVVNPANIAGLLIALAITVVLGVYRVGRRAMLTPAAPRPAPALVRTPTPQSHTRPAEPEAGDEPLTLLLALYRTVLRLVEGLAATALQANHTLREFVRECAPRLGPLAAYFQEFTLMAERLLYSRRRLSEAEAAHGRELGQRLKEGLGSENP